MLPLAFVKKTRIGTIFFIIPMIFCGVKSWGFGNEAIQFNADVLDVNDRKNIDLSQFSNAGYIMPGEYTLVIRVNDNEISEQNISFFTSDTSKSDSKACLGKSLAEKLGFKEGILSSVSWWHNGQCLDELSLKGMEVRGDLAANSLIISIPQAYLEYSTEYWDPPSQWDEGIPGVLFDYNISADLRQQSKESNEYNVSGNGTSGANIGGWRLRGDWQGVLNRNNSANRPDDSTFEFSRYYAYRAIPSLKSRLTLGEDFLNSGIFDSFRFTGASLVSDDNMLPPNLRGYAPEVVGVAKTNAKITVSQLGRVIYSTQVAAGPFRIQDISDAVSGEMNVRIEEQDGSVQEFKMDTSSIPYLTRPGAVRFKVAAGKPSIFKHHTQGPFFGAGEFSWGVSNGWSLYGGSLLGDDYKALSLGIGRDLLIFGAISLDATRSYSYLENTNRTLSGDSYRVSYSKNFEELDSQVTFAGYRFSDKNFMTMNEFLDANYYGTSIGNHKEMYTISLSKQFREWGFSTYLNYSHQTYWDRPENERYNLTASRYFDFGRIKNVSVSLSAYRNRYNEKNDDGMYLSISMPWGDKKNISYSTTMANNESSHRVSFFNRVDEHNNYQISMGKSDRGGNLSGYYNHDGDMAHISASMSTQQGKYNAIGLSAQGGLTLTTEGGGLHRSNVIGGTRLLVDTNGVSGIPVKGYGSTIKTNRFGKAIVSDVNSYYRNKASIDLNDLGNDAEATKSVVQVTLTEGAIGYRKFDLISGKKAMGVIRLNDGSQPPFGALVTNMKMQETGIVSDDGVVYLIGIKPGEQMVISWNGSKKCKIKLPENLTEDMLSRSMLLPCS